MNAVRNSTFLTQPPWALGRGQKVKYQLISITKSISNIFKSNIGRQITNEIYKTYQMGFFFRRLGQAPGMGLEGVHGSKGINYFFWKSTKFYV